MSLQFARSFPEEIHLEIVRQVDDRKTLAALSRVSKQFNEFAESYLYQTFDSNTFGGCALPYFIRTILQRPHLARYVRTWIGDACTCIAIDVDFYDQKDKLMLTIAIYWITKYLPDHLIGPEKWIIGALDGRWDCLASLLICLLPNLEELVVVGLDDSDGYKFMETVLQNAASLQADPNFMSRGSDVPKGLHRYHTETGLLVKAAAILGSEDIAPTPHQLALSNLRRISLSSYNKEYFPAMGMEPYHALPYLALPSLKHFSAHMVQDYYPRHFPSVVTLYSVPLPKFKFNVSHLSMTHSVVGPQGLIDFLRYFKVLEHFEYDFGYDFDIAKEESVQPEFVPPRMIGALAHLTGYLESLTLTQKDYLPKIEVPGEDEPIGSLAKFRKLKELKASAHLLLGRPSLPVVESAEDHSQLPQYSTTHVAQFFELFPASLEELTIFDCEAAVLDVVEELISRVALPKLTTVHLTFKTHALTKGSEQRLEAIEAAAMANGIEKLQWEVTEGSECTAWRRV